MQQDPLPSSPVIPPQPPLTPRDSTSSRDKKFKRDGLKSIMSTLLILITAPILAIMITAFVFQSYEVDGPSMEPTLQTQNRLIIWKAGRTWARITKQDFVPKRGEITVFVKHGMYDFDTSKEKQLIKRVIGLPGERVVVKQGIITVYNQENPDGFNPDINMEYGQFIRETSVGDADYTLGAREIFVVGDNRDNSLDSRSFGPIPVDDIIGTLSLRILPLGEIERF